MHHQSLQDLLTLSHELGREDRGLAILAEGNTSARHGKETFFVKASGASLGTLKQEDLVECRLAALLPLLEQDQMTNEQVDNALLASQVDAKAKKPSLEAIFHAYLLSLPGINFVGHTHAASVNQILCSPRAREFAEKRVYPDEIIACGVASVFVPYTDPGLNLSQLIRHETEGFVRKHQRQPRVILMQNHGIITLGPTWQSVLAAMLMAEKVAKVFTGAAVLGGPVFLSEESIQRFADRPDEAYRQRVLKL